MPVRDYGKIAPQFWTGETGKLLKAAGPEAVIVAMYLMTSPHANMIGLYYMPKLYIAHETGLGIKGASKGLARAIEAGFCMYDEASEYVLVVGMARHQIAEALKPDDKRCKGVENELAKAPKGALERAFREINAARFHLPEPDETEAPSKPLASQEQEQEQEQEQKKSRGARSPAGSRLPEDWEPTADMLAWAATARPDIDAKAETENFRDHWLAKAGKDATKLDWTRTWQKWIRSAYARPKPRLAAVAGYRPLPGEV